MAPRPNWKGYLKLGLVSCPIALYPATSTNKRVSFQRINKATGNRLRQQLVDESARYATPLPAQAHEAEALFQAEEAQPYRESRGKNSVQDTRLAKAEPPIVKG